MEREKKKKDAIGHFKVVGMGCKERGGRSPWLYSGGGEKKRIVIGFREAAMASASQSVEPEKGRRKKKKRGPDANIYKRETKREKGGNIGRERERGGERKGWLK